VDRLDPPDRVGHGWCFSHHQVQNSRVKPPGQGQLRAVVSFPEIERDWWRNAPRRIYWSHDSGRWLRELGYEQPVTLTNRLGSPRSCSPSSWGPRSASAPREPDQQRNSHCGDNAAHDHVDYRRSEHRTPGARTPQPREQDDAARAVARRQS
jgi:hypothetical protein